jgi:hypothetical protein
MFHVVSYNIFARSLGSNCIPWVLKVSSEWEHLVEEATGETWKSFVKECIWPEYSQHFHKNHMSGNKVEMRQLWSCNIRGVHDIPLALTGVRFVSEDCLEYVREENDSTSETRRNLLALTLPGVLKKHLPASLHKGLYSHIMETEKHFLWTNRGPKIFYEITRNKNEFDSSPMPDIISLCEYDVHEVRAVYRATSSRVNDLNSGSGSGSVPCSESREHSPAGSGSGMEESFSEAMFYSGYTGVLMSSPDTRDRSGLGVFWKRDTFRLESGEDISQSSLVLLPGDSFSNSVFNYDLNESYHKLHEASSRHELLHISERKHVSCVRLVHKSTGKLVLMVSVHLMTASKDSKANEYIGEIRACQLKRVKEIIAMHVDGSYSDVPVCSRPVDGVIVSGDFNTDITSRDIFMGSLASQISDQTLCIDTGLVEAEDPSSSGHASAETVAALHWHVDVTTTTVSPQDPQPLQKVIMTEAFADIHRWGNGVGSYRNPNTDYTNIEADLDADTHADTHEHTAGHTQRGTHKHSDTCIGESGEERHHCTSFSSSRCSWIDLVWYSPAHLRLVHATPPADLLTPSEPMPNARQPSDHMPLSAVFAFV